LRPPAAPPPSLRSNPPPDLGTAAVVTSVDARIDRWWLAFGDAELARLIDEALARNADLEAAVARVRQAQANADAAGASQWPTLDAQVQSGRAQQSTVGATPLPPAMDRIANSNKASLSTSYELDLWGRLSSSARAARQRLLATEWARASLEWTLTAQVAETYFQLAAVDRQVQISEAVRASQEATVAMRERERAVGAGNEFDLRRAQAELQGTDSTLASHRRKRLALEQSLLVLLGRDPAAPGPVERRALDEAAEATLALPADAAAALLARRPDVQRVEAELAAANADIAAARAALFPTLRLSGSVGSDARAFDDLFSGPAAIWSLAASLTQSIFDGGARRARVDLDRARAEETLADYRKVVTGAVADARDAYGALDLQAQALAAERGRVGALARAHELARIGHGAGAYSYLDLLDAERNWHQAQLQQVAAYRDQLIGHVAVYKALGGGYAAAPTLAQRSS
jgi:multidrug efflux system outer membrane protein